MVRSTIDLMGNPSCGHNRDYRRIDEVKSCCGTQISTKLQIKYNVDTTAVSTKTTIQVAKFQTQAKLSSFSHSKFNPFTKATQIQPKTKEGKVEPKAEREKGERRL
ncbi:hypothetical protein CMV_027741 [Castanea mollissima]|uniref:Uncharacterized protein n=1 Tax=Castanea mollissima TaxID=60419 RepID=A0A8J4Q9A1_9ROSI|nr:hypothetical protein CMV_027741 [Castanea mollissima]